jgi:hypothetical protein
MDNQQERLELNMHWFAGFLEAEGWFSLMKTNRQYKGQTVNMYVPVCGICNTDFMILEAIEHLFKSNGIEYQLYVREPRKKGYKKGWQINIQAMKKSMAFIEWIMPYLVGEKKIKAQKILEFCQLRKAKTTGFCGVGYSDDEVKLYEDISSKILNDYTLSADKVMI